MANPKTASEKYTQYQNDNFNVWVQKTNIVAREEGDLNSLSSSLLAELQAQTTKAGTVAGNVGAYTISGTGTSFLTDYVVGDTIKIIINTTVLESRIIAIATNTSLTIESKIPETFTLKAHENLKSLSLVSAVNQVYDGEARRVLIRAIAMS